MVQVISRTDCSRTAGEKKKEKIKALKIYIVKLRSSEKNQNTWKV